MFKRAANPVKEIDPRSVERKRSAAAVLWGILSGVLFGAIVGAAVGIFLRPKQELDELSQEWLDDLKDVTDQVSGKVRNKVTDLVSRRREPIERYEEYPGSYV